MNLFKFLFAKPKTNAYDGEVIPSEVNFAMSEYVLDDDNFKEVITSSSYLPRIQLCGSNSELAKNGTVPMGQYALIRSKDDVEILSSAFDFFAFSMRFKAMRMGDEIHSYYDPQADEFKKIVAESETPDSGCVFGVEYLVWVPHTSEYATFYFASKSARRVAPAVRTYLKERRFATAKSEFVKKQRYSWHAPVITACSMTYELPSVDEMQKQATTFANPPKNEVEKVENAGDAARER